MSGVQSLWCGRDTGIARGCQGTGDARNHFEFDARFVTGQHFFTTASEHVAVAALEATDLMALLGLFHKQGVDACLGQGVFAGELAH